MNGTLKGDTGGASRAFRRMTGRYRRIVARREHDAAMREPRLAAEHAFQVAYATSHGRSGCEFCR